MTNIFHLMAGKKTAQPTSEPKTNVVKPQSLASSNAVKAPAKPGTETKVEGRPDLRPTMTSIKPSGQSLEQEYQQRKESEMDPAVKQKRDSAFKEGALALAYRNATSKQKDLRSFGKQQLKEHPKEDRMKFLQSQKLLNRNKPKTPSTTPTTPIK